MIKDSIVIDPESETDINYGSILKLKFSQEIHAAYIAVGKSIGDPSMYYNEDHKLSSLDIDTSKFELGETVHLKLAFLDNSELYASWPLVEKVTEPEPVPEPTSSDFNVHVSFSINIEENKLGDTLDLKVTSPFGNEMIASYNKKSELETPAPEPLEPAPPAEPEPEVPSPEPTGKLSAIWASNTGNKILQSDLHASTDSSASINSCFDGSKVILHGAKNEVISFNLVLEALNAKASDLKVTISDLVNSDDEKILFKPLDTSDPGNFLDRHIEMFFVKYLQIKGLSRLSYDTYDERHIPAGMQRPYDFNGIGRGTWTDRPNHNKFYPEIAVPYNLINKFSIEKGNSQLVWFDIFIPKTISAGSYKGNINIYQADELIKTLPVELEVKSFELPDIPSSKTMLFCSWEDVNKRFFGTESPANKSEEIKLRDTHFKLAHRHKISLIHSLADDNNYKPSDESLKRLDGSLFTSQYGYDGPGINTSNNIYSIGTYGGWVNKNNKLEAQKEINAWRTYFTNNFPDVEHFLYLIDESNDFQKINEWLDWMKNHAGPGKDLPVFTTAHLTTSIKETPLLDIVASWFAVAPKAEMETALASWKSQDKKFYMYNGMRPATGSFATEDVGSALRELSWSQYKKNIDRWFFWSATYYNNYQGGTGETNVFKSAHTFGSKTSDTDAVRGESGWNYSNGDGVLFYPGTEKMFPEDSHEVQVPFASLRMKHWRRGIQDIDYLELAKQKSPDAVEALVNKMVPEAIWEYDVSDLSDPSWVRKPISWSEDAEDWEEARRELSSIIES